MRIIIVTTAYMPVPPVNYGGAELIAWQLAEGLADRGHDVYLVASKGSKASGKVNIIPTVPSSTANDEKGAYLVYKKKVEELLDKPDTVISDHSWSWYPYLLKIQHPHIKISHTFHGPNVLQMPVESVPLQQLKNGEWNLVAVSDAHAKYESEAIGGIPVRRIYNGVDENMYPFHSGDRSDKYLFYSVMNREKGINNFVEMMRKTGFSGIVAGEDVGIFDLQNVKNIINYINRELPNIEYFGRTNIHLKRIFMRISRAMLYPYEPTWFEAFGLAHVEAGMMGTPVIATESGSMLEITKDLPELYRAKPNNRIFLEDLPKINDDLLKNPKQVSEAFRKNAMKFTLSRMVDEYEKFYLSLV